MFISNEVHFSKGPVKLIQRPIYPFLSVGFLKNYIGKLKMVKWNRFDPDCKNE